MELDKRQKRIQRQLYRSAKGNPEQLAAIEIIFKTTENMTNREAADLIAEAFNDIEAEEIFPSLKESPLPKELQDKVKLSECPKCKNIVLGLKDKPNGNCSKCGSVLVDSDLPLSGLRINDD